MQSTTGLIVCVVIPIVLLVGYDIIRRRIYDKNKKKDTEALLAELQELRTAKAVGEGSENN
jgi:signal peptidase